jgi:hypothetical protein
LGGAAAERFPQKTAEEPKEGELFHESGESVDDEAFRMHEEFAAT